ncbi:MAG TPA: type II secretion system minor pseudopilin GspJ [Caulobacter sp.]|nr:type II secretion system minor pseudopilin GspJ [Caulobacter sp.]
MKGFTLVEMMAALFVFGLLTAAGTLVLGSTLQGQDAVRDRMARLGELQQTRAMLKADLGQIAVRPTRGQEGGARRPVFLGTPAADGKPFLGFARRGWDNPDEAPRPSVQYVEYRLSGRRLERVSFPQLDGAAPGGAQVLIDDIDAVKVQYLYRGAWAPVWTPVNDADYPQAVRLAFEVDGLGGFEQLFLTPGGPR